MGGVEPELDRGDARRVGDEAVVGGGLGDPAGEVDVRFEAAWSRSRVVDLVAMGPNAFHLDDAAVRERAAGLPDPVTTTVAVAVSTWRPRR